MKYNNQTRRAFLQGAGGFLFSIPFLPSIMGELAHAAPAAGGTKRLLNIFMNYGSADPVWFPNVSAGDFAVKEAQYKALEMAKIAGRGPISPIFNDPLFKKYADLLTIYRGIDGSRYPNHTKSGALTGHWVNDKDSPTMPSFPSIDYVVATKSKQVYTSEPKFRMLNLTTRTTPFQLGTTASYGEVGGKISKIPAIGNPIAAFDKVFKGVSSSDGTPDPQIEIDRQLKKSVLDRVLEDYNRILKSNSISKDDKEKLEATTDEFRTLERKVDSIRQAGKCEVPTRASTDMFDSSPDKISEGWFNKDQDIPLVMDLMSDIIVAAFKCGLTNVATFMIAGDAHKLRHIPGVSGNMASLSHQRDKEGGDGKAARDEIEKIQGLYLSKVARIVDKLQDIEDPGTGKRYIDNTLIFGTNEMGSLGNHRPFSLPVFTISGMPEVNSGWYIDYRTNNQIPRNRVSDINKDMEGYFGRDYNSLLIGILRTMGLQPSDWERNGMRGFGSYVFYQDYHKENDPTQGIITPGRRSAPPFMLKG